MTVNKRYIVVSLNNFDNLFFTDILFNVLNELKLSFDFFFFTNNEYSSFFFFLKEKT